MRNIPYGRQAVSEADIQAVADVMRSDFLTQGPTVPAFEGTVAQYCGASHGVAVNSATSALHIACLALGIRQGDRVWTSPITFVASANCALYCGATIDFVDIDPRTYNIDVDRLAEKLEEAAKANCIPKLVIPVHMCGQSCDMAAIYSLSQRYGFRIIEDASHAIGATYQGTSVGSCQFSDITVFSFHAIKIITTAEGGMALTNNAGLARRLRLLRSHGVVRDSADMSGIPEGPWYYEQVELGYNYRMTELQAALGLSQMSRLTEFSAKRRAIAHRYNTLLSDSPLQVPWQHPDNQSALHLYVVRLKLDQASNTHRGVFEKLRSEGIGVNLHYIPVYRHPYYARLGFDPTHYPEAERYYSEAITLPIHSELSMAEQEFVTKTLLEAVR